MHHGGFFCGLARNRAYFDGKVDWFDGCDPDEWSLLFLPDILKELGYAEHSFVSWYWCHPEYNVTGGLLPMRCDADTIMMNNISVKHKNLRIYIDHSDFVERQRQQNDDALIHAIATDPPTIINPKKVLCHENNGEKLPDFCTDISKIFIDNAVCNEFDADDNASGSENDKDFMDSDNDFGENDDDLFEDNVDSNVDDIIVQEKGKQVHMEELEGDDFVVHDELNMPDSDDEQGKMKFNFQAFNVEVDMAEPYFKVGMMFATIEEVRRAITEYSINKKVPIKKDRNDNKRVWASCDEGCPWMMKCGYDSRAKCFLVKNYSGTHTCENHWDVKDMTAKYLADRYLEFFRDDEKMSLKAFSKIVLRELKMCPSRHKLGRARQLALKVIHGDEDDQYNQLRAYGQELRKTNPGSTFYINVKADGTFSTLYFALDACKRGFLKGCRPIICFDGCHIKTKYGGQLLTAVGVDPNDCIFPIAMAVVETESTMTWEWFLTTLKNDLHIENTAPYTIMSDKQKVKFPLSYHICW